MTDHQPIPVEQQQPDPDIPDVLQMEPPEPATVPVDVAGPVRVQLLPHKSTGIKGLTLRPGRPEQLLRADPFRARALIIPDHKVAIGGSAQEIQGGQPGYCPAEKALEWTAAEELWAMLPAAAENPTIVTVIQFRWAEA